MKENVNQMTPLDSGGQCAGAEPRKLTRAEEIAQDIERLKRLQLIEAQHTHEVVFNKEVRRDIDWQIQKVRGLPASRERSLAITKLQEAVMWLGMDLKRLNEPNPYPNSKDPSNTIIEPTADGLKL